MKKIAIVTSHPVQYYAPLFAELSIQKDLHLKVFYTLGERNFENNIDAGFGKVINWDLPLLDGYDYYFTKNISRKPATNTFFGIITPNLINELEEFMPTYIWIWGWSFYSHMLVMFYFKGKLPIWFRGDSTLLDEPTYSFIRKISRRLLLKFVYSFVDIVFSVGSNNTLYFKKHSIQDDKIILAYHAIDNVRFRMQSKISNLEEFYWKNKIGIKDSKYIILFVGKLHSKKNPFFFLSVCNYFRNSDINGLIVGNGILESQLKEISDNAIFLDFQNQRIMPIIYKMANLLILPSTGPGETWGLVINEALACGLPVAASIKCGGAIDLINASNGFIFDPGDGISSFIEKLIEFKNKPTVDFQESFSEKFNYQRIIDAVLNQIKLN